MAWKDRVNNLLGSAVRTFGEDVTFLPKTGSPYTVQGIFDRKHIEVSIGQNIPILSFHPTLGINLNDFVIAPKQGDQFQIGAVLYDVIQSQEDGQGGSLLILHEAT